MSNRLSCLGALAAFIVAAFLSPFSRVAGSKGKNFYLYDFCIMKCKMALLLSAFAFAPSVLAEVPVVTLSVENIQVRAAWRVVGNHARYFRMDDNVLMFRQNIDAAGQPDGVTIIADVEVRDKFSTLNQNYQDLITRVKITTLIMGCSAHWEGRFAKSFRREGRNPPKQIVLESGPIRDGYVIARTNDNGNVFLYTVKITGTRLGTSNTYMTTSPILFDDLKWDTGKAASASGWTDLDINKSADCFAEEIEAFQQQQQMLEEQQQQQQQQQQILQQKTQYLNANAPPLNTGVFAGGVYAGDQNVEARVITVGNAFVLPGEQFFWLFDVTLVNILKELYPITVINNDVNNGGKAFNIVGDPRFYPKGSRSDVDADLYEYVINLPAGSSGYGRGNHQVIIVNSCPTRPPVSVIARIYDGSLRIDSRPGEPSITGLATYPYVLIDGVVYKFNGELTIATVGGGHILSAPGFDASSLTASDWPGTIKFADHFLCESIQ